MNRVGDLSLWTLTAGAVLLNDHAFGFPGNGAPSGLERAASQAVAVTAGQQVTGTVFYDARNMTVGPGLLSIRDADTGTALATVNLVAGTYGQATATVTVPAGTTHVLLRVGSNNATIRAATNVHVGNPQLVIAPDTIDPTLERPGVSDTALRVWNNQGPWADADPAAGWLLLHLCEALVGATNLDDIVTIVADAADGTPGWASVVDVDTCPATWLGWLGQLVAAASMPATGDQRSIIRQKPAWAKGKPAAIIAAAKLWLSGSQVVELHERDAGDAYKVSVVVQTAQVTDTVRLQAAVGANIPAGMVRSRIEIETGSSYAAVERDYPGTYTALEAAFANYTALTAYRTPTDLTTIGT